jgi:hypothetical protein
MSTMFLAGTSACGVNRTCGYSRRCCASPLWEPPVPTKLPDVDAVGLDGNPRHVLEPRHVGLARSPGEDVQPGRDGADEVERRQPCKHTVETEYVKNDAAAGRKQLRAEEGGPCAGNAHPGNEERIAFGDGPEDRDRRICEKAVRDLEDQEQRKREMPAGHVRQSCNISAAKLLQLNVVLDY